jgi:gas vesicle protein GvpL/GvpF
VSASTQTRTLLYMYAVAGEDAAGWIEHNRPAGLERGDLRAITESGLAAIVSEVPAESYGQNAIDESVRDEAWLTPRATTHQTVNAAAHASLDAVLPVPFATIFTTEDRVREMLRARAEELRAKLVGVRGQAEWVVGLYRDLAQATEHLSQVSDAVAHKKHDTGGPGRRYLEQKGAEGSRRAELGGLDKAAADSAHEMLARVSRHSYDEPVVQEVGELVARTTYLVRREDEHRLDDAIKRFNADWNDRGYGLRATGPWPPYRSSGAAE